MAVVRRNQEVIDAARQSQVAGMRLKYITRMNVRTAEIRQRFITALPGQDMIYQAKEDEARRYLLDEPATLDEFPFIAAEVGTLAETPYEVAQIWLNMGAQWRQIAAALENRRMTAIQSLSLAQTQEEMELVLDQFRKQGDLT